MIKLVLDTNVIISALIKSQSIPALILSLVLQGDCHLCLSNEILGEYTGVLKRNKFKRLDKASVGKLLSVLKKNALWVIPNCSMDDLVSDLSDKIFLECAVAAKADFIITGNKKHFSVEKVNHCKILSPREFITNFPKINKLLEGTKKHNV